MIIGAYRGDVLFDVFLFLHILTAIVGFGSTFVYPMMAAKSRAMGTNESYAVGHTAEQVSAVITSPFIYAVGVTGVILIVVSDGLIEFSEPWISAAFLLYIVGICVSEFVHKPNLKAIDALQGTLAGGGGTPTSGGPPAEVAELQERGKKAGMFGGILHLIFLLLLLDMIFKPGA